MKTYRLPGPDETKGPLGAGEQLPDHHGAPLMRTDFASGLKYSSGGGHHRDEVKSCSPPRHDVRRSCRQGREQVSPASSGGAGAGTKGGFAEVARRAVPTGREWEQQQQQIRARGLPELARLLGGSSESWLRWRALVVPACLPARPPASRVRPFFLPSFRLGRLCAQAGWWDRASRRPACLLRWGWLGVAQERIARNVQPTGLGRALLGSCWLIG